MDFKGGLKMKDEKISKMADLLRSGATMLPETCPVCNSPLFKVKGDIFCASCNKPVRIIHGEREEKEAIKEVILHTIEEVLFKKLDTLSKEIAQEEDYERLMVLLKMLDAVLENIRKIKKIE